MEGYIIYLDEHLHLWPKIEGWGDEQDLKTIISRPTNAVNYVVDRGKILVDNKEEDLEDIPSRVKWIKEDLEKISSFLGSY